jgi:hypothetical protein
MQRAILGCVPLRDLARLACLCKDLRTPYQDRHWERDTAVAKALGCHFTAEFREALTPSQTALPHDLIVDPPVRALPLLNINNNNNNNDNNDNSNSNTTNNNNIDSSSSCKKNNNNSYNDSDSDSYKFPVRGPGVYLLLLST